MNDPLTPTDVEARLRRTFAARAEDMAPGDDADDEVVPLPGREAPRPRRRALLVAVAAVTLPILAVTAYAARSGSPTHTVPSHPTERSTPECRPTTTTSPPTFTTPSTTAPPTSQPPSLGSPSSSRTIPSAPGAATTTSLPAPTTTTLPATSTTRPVGPASCRG